MKLIFLPVVVSIVLPVLYAAWRPNGAPLQRVTILLESRHNADPEVVCSPVITRFSVADVLKVTSFPFAGENVAELVAVIGPLNSVEPSNVAVPVTPSVPPRVVAPVPTEKVFAPVTEVFPLRLTSPLPVEKVAPIPDCVKSPVNASVPLNVALTADRSPAEVTLPPKEVAPVPRNW